MLERCRRPPEKCSLGRSSVLTMRRIRGPTGEEWFEVSVALMQGKRRGAAGPNQLKATEGGRTLTVRGSKGGMEAFVGSLLRHGGKIQLIRILGGGRREGAF